MPKSFVEALKAKYCEDEDDTSNFIVSFVYTNRPRKNSGGEGDAELAYLTSVVLSMYKVTHAGIPSNGLASLCPNISDLDLSSNLIGCWHEVVSILRCLDNLKFVNLSGNILRDSKKCLPGISEETFGVENLVLNNTGVPWEEIVMVTRCLPHLKELHASKNDYKDISVSGNVLCQTLPRLKVLHLTDNQFARWEHVAQLASLRHLHTLMLSGNPLSNIHYSYTGDQLIEDSQGAARDPKTCDDCEESGAGVKDIVEALMEELVGEAISATASMSSSSPPSPKKCDPQSCDSGMEDCLPNQNISPAYTKSNSTGKSSSVHTNNSSKKDSPTHTKILSGKSSPAHTKNSSGKTSPVELEMKLDVNTDKFAYFEIEWDGDDEAIGHEEEEEEEEEERKERDRRAEELKERVQNEDQDQYSYLFPNLKVLCVTNTRVDQWSDLESIRAFPKLDSLRIKSVPFLQDLDMEERRKLLVASLPNISSLNGSEITLEEREKSERFFIRHLCDHPEPPSWLSDLVAKHGSLRPITEINLGCGFKEYAQLSFFFEGRCICTESIRVVQFVSHLRDYCAQLTKKSRIFLRLYHLSKGRGNEPDEYNLLNQDLLPMSRYDMMDGDEIHIDITDPQKHGYIPIPS